MNIKLVIKNIISFYLFKTGILHRNIKNSSNHHIILMYHRIVEPEKQNLHIEPGMYVRPETFETHIEYLKDNYEICTLKDLYSHVMGDLDKENKRPKCCITFDDGWYDFYQNAYPVLKKNNVPATVFLPTDYINTCNRFWTDQLSFNLSSYFNNSKRIKEPTGNPLINYIEHTNDKFENVLDKVIFELKKIKYDEIVDLLMFMEKRWGIKVPQQENVFLSWKDVRKISKDGLVTFGGHTASHRIMTTLSEVEIVKELNCCKNKLLEEDVVEPAFIPFCYPNGNYNDVIAQSVKNAGYSLAVTTKRGKVNNSADVYTLNRMGIHQDISSSKAMFGCVIAGIF